MEDLSASQVQSASGEGGFTLAEFLALILMLAVLAAIAIPAFGLYH
jgi:Tfp pilus assembly protein PilE